MSDLSKLNIFSEKFLVDAPVDALTCLVTFLELALRYYRTNDGFSLINQKYSPFLH